MMVYCDASPHIIVM